LGVERFDEYKARTEPGSDLAGRKAAYVDRIEWIEVPNEETKVAGLKTGEWDVLDTGGLDFLEEFQEDPEIMVEFGGPVVSTLDFNVTSEPADNRLVRQAIQAAVDVETFMYSLGPRELWDLCDARYFCGTPWASHAGSEFYDTNDMEEAQRLLAESGYAGETFFFMNPTDYAILTPLGIVAKPMIEEIGITVDMPAMDWATLLSKFPDPDWDLFPDGWGLSNLPDPVGDSMVSGTLYFGNYGKSDMIDRVKDLRLQFALETDPKKAMEIVDALQIALYEDVPQIRLGVFRQFHANRPWVKNFVVNTQALFHNVWLER
jgi:peptide/nickel transport system substrate-binding protein